MKAELTELQAELARADMYVNHTTHCHPPIVEMLWYLLRVLMCLRLRMCLSVNCRYGVCV